LRAEAPLWEEGLGLHSSSAVAGGIDGPPSPKGLLIGLRQGARETFPQMPGTFRTHPEVVKEIRRAGGESLTQLPDYPPRTAKNDQTRPAYTWTSTMLSGLESMRLRGATTMKPSHWSGSNCALEKLGSEDVLHAAGAV
jgi:hypothetical protein